MVANNWSAPILSIRHRLHDTERYANASEWDLAMYSLRAIDCEVAKAIMAMEAEQARRKELEVKR